MSDSTRFILLTDRGVHIPGMALPIGIQECELIPLAEGKVEDSQLLLKVPTGETVTCDAGYVFLTNDDAIEHVRSYYKSIRHGLEAAWRQFQAPVVYTGVDFLIRARLDAVDTKTNTGSRRMTSWFYGIITSLDRVLKYKNDRLGSICGIGGGSVQPSVSDVDLEKRLANSRHYTGVPVNDIGCHAVKFKFTAGVSYDISEIALFNGQAELVSRALVQDKDGKPITVVTEDYEELYVTWELVEVG